MKHKKLRIFILVFMQVMIFACIIVFGVYAMKYQDFGPNGTIQFKNNGCDIVIQSAKIYNAVDTNGVTLENSSREIKTETIVTENFKWDFGTLVFDNNLASIPPSINLQILFKNNSLFPVTVNCSLLNVELYSLLNFDINYNNYVDEKIGDNLVNIIISVKDEKTLIGSGSGGLALNFNLGFEKSLKRPESPVSDFTLSGMAITKYNGTEKNVVIPNSVSIITNSAFSGNTNIESVIIPNSVTTIESGAFSSCSKLKAVTLPNNMTSIPNSLFFYSQNLTNVVIPPNVTKIEAMAFGMCKNLTSINIPDGITTIDTQAFSSCAKLTSFRLPSSLTSLGSGALNGTKIAYVNIPKGLLDITNLPSGNAVSYEVDSLNPNFVNDMSGNLLSKDKQILLRYPGGKNLKEYTIPNNITTIGNSAFSNCAYLEKLTAKSNVKIIEDSAFSSSKIKEVILDDSITSLGAKAFYYCEKLISVKLPNSITEIKEDTFNYCYALKRIEIPNNVISIKERAFSMASGLNSIFIPSSVTSIGAGAFFYTGLESVTIPASVSEIEAGAFERCFNLKSVYFERTVLFASLGSSSFMELPFESVLYFKNNLVLNQFTDTHFDSSNTNKQIY